MRRPIFATLACIFMFAAGNLAAAEGWKQLKFGMSTEETNEALGIPLIKNRGGGFELWIYDNGAEAVFYGGPLVGWTSPATAGVIRRVVDVWQRQPGADAPVFILPRAMPIRKRPFDRARENEAKEAGVSRYHVRG